MPCTSGHGVVNVLLRVRVLAVVVVVLVLAVLVAGSDSQAKSRQKRYLHFPFGSTLRIAFSSKWSTIFDKRTAPAFWTEGFNWGVTYDLPNGTQLLGPSGFGGFASRRHRRDLYRRLEKAIDSTGFLGKPCLLRAICEAPQFLPSGDNVVAEILRIILWSPLRGDTPSGSYDLAQHAGKKGHNCADLYRSCPFSILQLLLSMRAA